MRVSFLAIACLFRLSVTGPALAQDTPAAPPPEAPKPPQAEPPPAEGTPPPASPPPSEPAPAPPAPAPPPTPPPSEPAPAPPTQPHATAPAHVTLEETPEAPPAGSKPAGAKHKAKVKTPHRAKPHEEKTAPPPASASAPAIAAASATEDAPEAAPSDGEEPESKSKDDKSKDDESKSKDDDGEGLFGPFRIGALVGVGLPGVLTFGGMIKLTRYFGAGLNIGVIPAVRLSYYGQADISYQEYDLYGRLFPFGGNLFVGAGVGYATMNGSFRTPPVDTTAYQNPAVPVPNPLLIVSEGSVKTLILTPMLGIMHTWAAGFTLGLDFGAQIPIAPSKVKFETRLPPSVPPQIISQYVEPSDAKVRSTLDTVGRTILPTLNFRIGWLL